jgi:formylglycine-generating enzyme required for sulfatase activity
VEQVSWSTCDALLRRYALTVPTEAQWERGCRADTTTPWYTGADPASLEGHVNLQDQTALREWDVLKRGVPFADGFLGTAPVGSYLPNAFGLHDMHGNVAEWVREQLPCPYSTEPRAGDGFRPTSRATSYAANITRGGSFMDLAPKARVALRRDAAAGMTVHALGIRPARELRILE